MSILSNTHQIVIDPALLASTQIKERTAVLADTLIEQWETAFDQIWHNPQTTPKQVLSLLGTDAAEVFELSAATVQFLAHILPDRREDDWQRISTKVAALPELIKHENGIITIAASE